MYVARMQCCRSNPRQALRRYPAYRLRLPPKRIFFHSTTVDFVEERREQLDVYLRTLLADPNLCSALYALCTLRHRLTDPALPVMLLVSLCCACQRRVVAATCKLAMLQLISNDVTRLAPFAGTKDVWEFLSAWSEVYGTEENTSLLKAMGHSLDAARTNVRRFAGDVGKVRSVTSMSTQMLSISLPVSLQMSRLFSGQALVASSCCSDDEEPNAVMQGSIFI